MGSYRPIHHEAVDDDFESSENNDLPNLTEVEYWRLWQQWFKQAQRSNDRDAHVISHGVMLVEPGHEHLESEVLHGAL